MSDYNLLVGKPVSINVNARGWWLDRDDNIYTVAVDGGKGRFPVGSLANREEVDRFRLEVREPLMERQAVENVRGILEDRPDIQQVCLWRDNRNGRVGTPIFYREIEAIELIRVNEIGSGPHGSVMNKAGLPNG